MHGRLGLFEVPGCHNGTSFRSGPQQTWTASLPGLPPRKKTVFRKLKSSPTKKNPACPWTGGVLTLTPSANKITFVTQNYIQLVLGIWILLSPWLLGFSSISFMTWSNLIAGIILILINVWAIFGEADESNERSSSQTNNQ